MKFWLYFITLFISNLTMILLTKQLLEYHQSTNDMMCIDRSAETIVLDIVKIHEKDRVTYEITSHSDVIGDGLSKKANLIKYNDVFELHINESATMVAENDLRLVILIKDNLSSLYTEKPHHNFINDHLVNEIGERMQHKYQFINPEIDVGLFKGILQDPKQSALKRKRKATVHSTLGNEYYIAFIPLFGFPPSIALLSSSDKSIDYLVEAPETEFQETGTVLPNDVNPVDLPYALSGETFYSPFCQNNSFKEGIYLHTASDELTVIGIMNEDRTQYNTDTFFAIPIKNFCIAEYTYFAVSVDTFVAADGSIVIVGTADQTMINISVPTSAVIKPDNFKDWESLEPGIIYTNYTINRLGIIYIAAFTTDLTGTKITTDKPISLFSGHECAFIPYTIFSCDHLAEQIPPTELWGTVHYFAPLANRTSYMIKIVAAYDFTNIDIYCNDILTSDVIMINAGEFINMTYDDQEFCGVYSDKKVLVAQFSLSYYTDLQGDPMMTIIPATSHYTNSITSSTFFTSEQNVSSSHFVNIIVLANHYQPDMMLVTAEGVNRSLDLEIWEPIVVRNVTEAYAAQVEMPEGIFTVIHLNKSAMMTVVVYGFTIYLDTLSPNKADGYGHPGWLMDQLSIVVSLEKSEYTEAEGDNFTVTIALNDEASEDFIVVVNVTDETAIAEMDYSIIDSVFNVTVAAGETSSSFTISIIDDKTQEDNETLNIAINLLPTTLPLSLCISSSTLTIIDHDEITICFNESLFNESTVHINEEEESASFSLVLSNPSSHDLIITVNTIDETAIGDVDYEAGPFNFIINAGETFVPFNISIYNNDVFQGNKSFNLSIHSPSLSHKFSVQSDCMLTVVIMDDDKLTVKFVETAYEVYEYDQIVQLTLALDDPSPFDETVQLININDTAYGEGIDYNSGPYNAIFPAGSTNTSFDIIIHDDTVSEVDEIFNVSICSITNGHIVGNPKNATVTILDTTSVSSSSGSVAVRAGGSVGGSLVLLILLSILITMWCVIRAKRKKKMQYNDRIFFSKSASCIINIGSSTDVECNKRNSRRASSAYLYEELQKQQETNLINKCKLLFEEQIAKGNFGVVRKGWYDKENLHIKVAIKTLNDVSSSNVKEFIKECSITTKFNHPNVLTLIGVCVNTEEGEVHMVMPFMHHGDVRTYLRAKRSSLVEFDRFPKDLNFDLLIKLCLDIAKGMEYLSSRHFVHRDLAARNCMLDEEMNTKVADFGLSRDMYISNYYVMSQKIPLPVKWLAPEALLDKMFSEKTDVWAFGVTCWEIFSLGLQPYPTVDPHEMSDYLKSRKLLEKPSLTSDEFYNIMKTCWNFKPEDRPCFTALVENISNQKLSQYKNLTSSYLRVYN